jgi:hypothetical protein
MLTPSSITNEELSSPLLPLHHETNVDNLKLSIISQLFASTPLSILDHYKQQIEPWFPLFEASQLQLVSFQHSWDELSLEQLIFFSALNCLMTPPQNTTFLSRYGQLKGNITATEVIGMNNLFLVNSRVVVALFEMSHGMFPASYISLGAALRAVNSLSLSEDDYGDLSSVLCGAVVLDR